MFDRVVGALGASIAQEDYLAWDEDSGQRGDYMGTDGVVNVEFVWSGSEESTSHANSII